MSKTGETGIAKSLTNFSRLIIFCTGYGVKYASTNPSLSLPSLQLLSKNTLTSLDNEQQAKAEWQSDTGSRRKLFNPLKKLSTQVINILSSCGASQERINNAISINVKLQGKRVKSLKNAKPVNPVKPVVVDDAPNAEMVENVTKTHSVSQQSFDQKINNLAQLIQILLTEPLYVPNETELTTASLQDLLANMRDANQAVAESYSTYINYRIEREALFNEPLTGVVDKARAVKKYVKGVFGKSSIQYKEVASLKIKGQ